MITMNDRITIKGTKKGLLFATRDMSDVAVLINEMTTRFESTPAFFRGAQITLATGDLVLEESELSRIKELCERHGASLAGVISTDEMSRGAARNLGLQSELRIERPLPHTHNGDGDEESGEALLVRRTLRSGQLVEFAGSVTVIGDVNPGAEIIAGGDIVVWGMLRGSAHAGALGDERAVICALQIAPTLLRIGSRIGRPPEGQGIRRAPTPEVAWVDADQILVDAWDVWARQDRNRTRILQR
jgi:septum site-determining protein MinC